MEFREIQAKGLERASGAARCCYLKPSGERCGSPAMRGFDLCYYHDRYQPRSGYRNLPCLEDPHSVQCAIQEIIEDMLAGLLDYKKAALALYGLQTAASNLKQMRIAEQQRRQREEEQQTDASRTQGTRTTQGTQRDLDSLGGARLQPCRNAAEETPASAAEAPNSFDETEEFELIAANVGRANVCTDEFSSRLSSRPESRAQPRGEGAGPRFSIAAEMHIPRRQTTAARDDSGGGEPEVPALSRPTTDDRQPTTPLIESPRPPQHVRFGLTARERERMKHHFPDLKKIREEVLASLTPEERAQVEASAMRKQTTTTAIACGP